MVNGATGSGDCYPNQERRDSKQISASEGRAGNARADRNARTEQHEGFRNWEGKQPASCKHSAAREQPSVEEDPAKNTEFIGDKEMMTLTLTVLLFPAAA